MVKVCQGFVKESYQRDGPPLSVFKLLYLNMSIRDTIYL